MSKRFVTYANIAVPPFKEDKIGAGSTTIRFVLAGNIISKKNNQQAIAVRSHARKFLFEQYKKNGVVTLNDALKAVGMVKGKMRGNAKYLDFLKKQKPHIQKQMLTWRESLGEKGLIFPIPKATFTLRLYIKDRYRRDTPNAIQTVTDLLVDSGVIADDDDRHLISFSAKSARYYEELIHNIAFISLSFKL